VLPVSMNAFVAAHLLCGHRLEYEHERPPEREDTENLLSARARIEL
jgi:hypothetical protein